MVTVLLDYLHLCNIYASSHDDVNDFSQNDDFPKARTKMIDEKRIDTKKNYWTKITLHSSFEAIVI